MSKSRTESPCPVSGVRGRQCRRAGCCGGRSVDRSLARVERRAGCCSTRTAFGVYERQGDPVLTKQGLALLYSRAKVDSWSSSNLSACLSCSTCTSAPSPRWGAATRNDSVDSLAHASRFADSRHASCRRGHRARHKSLPIGLQESQSLRLGTSPTSVDAESFLPSCCQVFASHRLGYKLSLLSTTRSCLPIKTVKRVHFNVAVLVINFDNEQQTNGYRSCNRSLAVWQLASG
jgi:hypothetical protein